MQLKNPACKNQALTFIWILGNFFFTSSIFMEKKSDLKKCTTDGLHRFCLNGGCCLPQVTGRKKIVKWRCTCTKFYTGPRCEIEVDGSTACKIPANPCRNGGVCKLKSEWEISDEAKKWTDVYSRYWCDCTKARYKKSGKLEGQHCEKYIEFSGKCKDFCKKGKCTKDDALRYKIPKYEDGLRCACDLGFNGSKCEKKCESGRFGLYCENDCSFGCKKTYCHYKTGKCKCKTGFRGDKCSTELKWLPGCTTTANNLKKGACVHGKCKAIKNTLKTEYQHCQCFLGYNGSNCENNCNKFSRYGKLCSEPCGHCAQGACKNTDGQCPKVKGKPTCEEPYYGKKCRKSEKWEIDGSYGLFMREQQIAAALKAILTLTEAEVNEENRLRLEKALKLAFGKRVNAKVDSQRYLGIINRLSPDEREELKRLQSGNETTTVINANRIIKRQVSDATILTVKFTVTLPADIAQGGGNDEVGQEISSAIVQNEHIFKSDKFPGAELDKNSVKVISVALKSRTDSSRRESLDTQNSTGKGIGYQLALCVLALGLAILVAGITYYVYVTKRPGADTRGRRTGSRHPLRTFKNGQRAAGARLRAV